jgi:hypothetical protein
MRSRRRYRPDASRELHPQATPLLLAEWRWPVVHATDQRSKRGQGSPMFSILSSARWSTPSSDATITRKKRARRGRRPRSLRLAAGGPAKGSDRNCFLGSSAHGRQPPQQEKVVAAKSAAVGPQDPVDGLLHRVANTDASEIDRFAMRTTRGEHSFWAFLTVSFRRASGTLHVRIPECGH